MKLLLPSVVFLTFAFCSAVTANPQTDDHKGGFESPKIGLALSGGGARGTAHIGVIRALEEMGIRIDYIAGTSMGSIIGGLYAAGFTSDEMTQLLADVNWNEALRDSPERRNKTMRKKELDSDFLIPYRIGIGKDGIRLPLGVVEGQHLDQLFHRIFLPVEGVKDFDRLHIPFRAVATDLETGEEVIIDSGSLASALRASMSVPGVFAPVRHNGKMLVDGGMANNLPVSVVREMGADIVIAVDISTPLYTKEQLDSVLKVTEQLTGLLTRRNTEAQIASLTERDVLIIPPIGDFSSANFDESLALIEIGLESTLEQSEKISALSNARPRGAPDWAGRDSHEFIVHFIEIDNDSVLNDEIIRSRLRVPIGEPLDIDALEVNLDQIYSLDVFGSVTYEFVKNDSDETGLLIKAQHRSWGPHYVQFGLEFSDDFTNSSDFRLGGAYTRNALNALGGEFQAVFSIGREDELSFDFYQPIDRQAHWFVQPSVFALRNRINVFQEETLAAEVEVETLGARIGFGRNFGTTNRLQLNYEFGRGNADVIAGDLGFPLDQNLKLGELVGQFRHDSLSSFWFPRTGQLHSLNYRLARESLGASADYEQAFALGSIAKSWGRNTLMFNYNAAYSIDDAAPVERWFELGGFGRLSGLLPDQLAGRHLGLATLVYFRKLNDVNLVPAYAGVTAETGNVWNLKDDISFDDLRYSGSLFIGAETPIGPVYFAWGKSDNGDSTFYFFLGNPFSGIRF